MEFMMKSLALTALLATASLSFATQQKAPSIAFEYLTKDLGKVTQGQKATHIFKFSNKGLAPLEISRVESSCGCTAAILSSKVIQPGETGQIEVTVSTEGVVSKITKSVTVNSNDPLQPQMVLNVSADVEPEFTLSERSIYFGNVARGKEVVRELIVSIQPGKSMKLLSAESTDPNVTVKLESIPAPAKGSPGAGMKSMKLIAVQKADTKEGYHFGEVVIKTTSTFTPEIKISVRGMVTAATQNN
jgi:hypothetical protein